MTKAESFWSETNLWGEIFSENGKLFVRRLILFWWFLAQAFAANCICKIHSLSTRCVRSLYIVHELSSNERKISKRKNLGRAGDSNLGMLGEKRKCYLCYAAPLPQDTYLESDPMTNFIQLFNLEFLDSHLPLKKFNISSFLFTSDRLS